MGYEVAVAYYTTKHGVMQQQTGKEVVHYGKVFKIPKALFSEDGDVDLQQEISDLLEEIQGKGMIPVLENATVERYEAWDMDGEDVWVMYRVPCQQK